MSMAGERPGGGVHVLFLRNSCVSLCSNADVVWVLLLSGSEKNSLIRMRLMNASSSWAMVERLGSGRVMLKESPFSRASICVLLMGKEDRLTTKSEKYRLLFICD